MPDTPFNTLAPQVKRSIYSMYGIFFFGNLSLDLVIWSFFFTRAAGLSIGLATSVHALIFITIAIADLPSGSWSDRIGRKQMAMFGYFFRLLATAITLTFPTLLGLCIASILAGLGWAFLSGALEALLFDNLKALGREDIYQSTFANANSFMFLARSVGFFFSTILFTTDMTLPYVMMAIGITIAGILLFCMKEQPFAKSDHRNDWQQLKAAGQSLVTSPLFAAILFPWLLINSFAQGIWITFQPLFSSGAAGIFWTGSIYSVGGLGSLIGSQLVKKVDVQKNFRITVQLYVSSQIAGCVFLILNQSIPALMIGTLVLSLGWGIYSPLRSKVLNSYLPSAQRNSGLSCYATMETLICAVLFGGLGFITEAFSPRTTMMILAASMAISTPLIMRRRGAP